MENKKYDSLNLDSQLCFPLYAVSREIMKHYRPFLDELGITYTQYVTLTVLWEEKTVTLKDLGKRLHLDSGTLTPVLKLLESKGLVSRQRSKDDERVLIVGITPKGTELGKRAVGIPDKVAERITVDKSDADELYRLLYKVLSALEES